MLHDLARPTNWELEVRSKRLRRLSSAVHATAHGTFAQSSALFQRPARASRKAVSSSWILPLRDAI